MSDALKALNNLRTLRAQTRDIEVAVLNEMLEKLAVVVAERREEAEADNAAQREKAEKLALYKEMLMNDGIDISELAQLNQAETKPKAKRAPRPAKYKYPMKKVMKSSGRVRAARLLRLRPLLMPAHRWTIF